MGTGHFAAKDNKGNAFTSGHHAVAWTIYFKSLHKHLIYSLEIWLY